MYVHMVISKFSHGKEHFNHGQNTVKKTACNNGISTIILMPSDEVPQSAVKLRDLGTV